MTALNRKLVRDLWRVKGQVLAIAAVIASGVAMYILMLSAFDSLDLTQREYYGRYRFADVFASCKRAPSWLGAEIAAIPGVKSLQTRVVAEVTLDVPGLAEPATGRLVSIPVTHRPTLNDLHLMSGRWLEPNHRDEVIVLDTFAKANELHIGDTVSAVINGRRRELQIVGLALSPEFVYTIRPGEIVSDEQLYGVLWMDSHALATAFDMEGGFNDVLVSLEHGTEPEPVIARLDSLLEAYGGTGAIARSLQSSHFFLQAELDGLHSMGQVVPILFLAVAAFLLNVVLARTVTLEREQIAAIKALGYANSEIAWHYVKWALVVTVLGAIAGVAAGAKLGAGMTRMYTEFYTFPILRYQLDPALMVQGLAISLAAAVIGAAAAVRRAVVLPPAEAMRPEPPGQYRVSLLERLGIHSWLSQPGRMILRHLTRRPVRAIASVLGISFGGAILVGGTFSLDAMQQMMDRQFNLAQRQDITVTFVEPTSSSVLHDLRRLPGVLFAEPSRSVAVRFRLGHRHRTGAITGVIAEPRLQRVVDMNGRPVAVPPDGLVLSAKLAELLGAERGSVVRVEVLEGRRPHLNVEVVAVVPEALGTSAYMRSQALHRLLHEGEVLTGATLQVDDLATTALYQRLKELPSVAGINLKKAAVRSFNETLMENFGIVRTASILFASIIAAGVVYNTARISLSERGRELATLRVIGLTQGEISYILLGELTLLTLAAVPLGLLLGYGMAAVMTAAWDTELFRIPLAVATRTYARSAVTVLVASAISGLIVRRRLDRLDLIEVLKTRE